MIKRFSLKLNERPNFTHLAAEPCVGLIFLAIINPCVLNKIKNYCDQLLEDLLLILLPMMTYGFVLKI